MMEDWTPADFRASREGIGLAQIDIADECHVRVLAVKKWERGESRIPADAWDTLMSWQDRHDDAVRTSLDVAYEQFKRFGVPHTYQITYYRTQAEYDKHGRDKGPFGFVNSVSREVASVLAEQGVEVRFVYPQDRMEQLDETIDK